MDSLLLILALTLIVAAFVLRPLVGAGRGMRGPASGPSDAGADLRAERERILNAIQELDFDHATGKIADEDYVPQRADLLREGVAVLKALDDLGVSAGRGEEDLEAAVGRTDGSRWRAGAEIEAAVAAHRRTSRGKRAAPANGGEACHNCGRARRPDDRFCSNCGASFELRGEAQ